MTRANVSVLTVLCLNGIFTLVRSQLSEEDKTDIVNTHNRLRRSFAKGADGVQVANMRRVEWSPELEQVAQETLNLQCQRTYVNFNQDFNWNKKINSTGNYTGDIISWYNEIRQSIFDTTHGVCYPSYRSCMQAYRMLHAQHRHVGCAYRTDCMEGNTFLCLYRQQSNVFPFYKAGLLCSQCDDGTSFCDDGLCVACDSRTEECDCRKSCERHQVGVGTLDNSTCTCNCQYGMGPNCDEPCENPETFVDYDICETVPEDSCDDYDFLREFCPALCLCKKFPVD